MAVGEVGLGFKDVIGLVYTGILTLLWWDIRKIRGERDEHKKEVKKEIAIMVTTHDHELLCKVAKLEAEKNFTKELDDLKEELLKAIKSWNKS